MIQFYRRLYEHMAWGDALVWSSIQDNEAALADDYVLDGLFHIHLVQRAYSVVWRGDAFELPSREDFAGPDAVCAWGQEGHAELRRYLGSLDDAGLAETFTNPWSDAIEEAIGIRPTPSTISDTVFQVASHSVHHRAQINRRIREVGGSPAMIDYIGWVWRDCPAPDWPA